MYCESQNYNHTAALCKQDTADIGIAVEVNHIPQGKDALICPIIMNKWFINEDFVVKVFKLIRAILLHGLSFM